MQRYIKINDYYIEDQYTGQKLDQKRTIKRLNKYEAILNDINKNETEIHP